MNRLRWRSIVSGTIKVAWIVMLVSLPFTSFPYLPPAIGGGALVRPFSIYPLIILMVLVTIPRMWRRPIPRTVLIVIPFILASLLSGMISLLRGIDPAYGITVFERIIRSLITIGIGFSYYLTISLMPRTLDDLKGTLRWIYVGMGVALAWGSLQAVYVLHWNNHWYQLLNKLQEIISIRRLIENRVSGFTYEPNWFAEQISMLLFPWLLASVLTGKSVFRWRWRWLTIEWIFLGWSVALIPLTFFASRRAESGRPDRFVPVCLSHPNTILARRRTQTGHKVLQDFAAPITGSRCRPGCGGWFVIRGWHSQ